MKLLATICFLILTAAPVLAWRRHDTRTVNDLAKSYTGLAVVLACDIPRRKRHVTDRQHRARSRACIDPALLKRCGFCGSSRNMRVHHLNGNESDEDPRNLIGACHACNTQVGFLLKRHNIGRRVDLEYNPPAQPARNLAQWMMAVKSMHGESSEMTPRQAIAMIRATSPARRAHRETDWSGIGFDERLLQSNWRGRILMETPIIKPFTELGECVKCGAGDNMPTSPMIGMLGSINTRFCPGGKEPEEEQDKNPIQSILSLLPSLGNPLAALKPRINICAGIGEEHLHKNLPAVRF